MKQKQPINLDLGSLKYPPMAIASILHRISGLLLFVLLPLMLYWFGLSMHSEATFETLQLMLLNPFYKLCLWLFSASLVYHLLAGIRHLVLDFGVGETLIIARRSAVFVIATAIILTIVLGVMIW